MAKLAPEHVTTQADVLDYLDYLRDALCDPDCFPLSLDDSGLAAFTREEMIKSVAEARFVVAIAGPDERVMGD